jgi:hypothetical protein
LAETPEDRRLEDEIRLRAYYRFLARGPDEGSDFDDWLRAAEELRDRLNETEDQADAHQAEDR